MHVYVCACVCHVQHLCVHITSFAWQHYLVQLSHASHFSSRTNHGDGRNGLLCRVPLSPTLTHELHVFCMHSYMFLCNSTPQTHTHSHTHHIKKSTAVVRCCMYVHAPTKAYLFYVFSVLTQSIYFVALKC